MSRAAGDRYRTFISVELSEETRARVRAVGDGLRLAGARLRWVRAEHLHFTLRFLGEITAAQVARAVVAVRETAQAAAPFEITLGGLGAFPSVERPQVVWLGVTEGATALVQLAEELNAGLTREHFPAEPRPFRPHLTLGRARDDRQWGDLLRALVRHEQASAGTERVEAVTVMDSRLTREGPIYTPREQVRLGHGLNP